MAERMNLCGWIERRLSARRGDDPVATFAALVMLGATAAINSTVWGIVSR